MTTTNREDAERIAATLPVATAPAAAKVRKPRRPRCEACQFARDILADTEESHRVRCTHRAVAK